MPFEKPTEGIWEADPTNDVDVFDTALQDRFLGSRRLEAGPLEVVPRGIRKFAVVFTMPRSRISHKYSESRRGCDEQILVRAPDAAVKKPPLARVNDVYNAVGEWRFCWLLC